MLVALVILVALTSGGDEVPAEQAADDEPIAEEPVEADEGSEVDEEPEPEPEAAPETVTEPEAESEPEPQSDLTAGQENALRSARSYLGFSGFSRSGLIEQLEFEGYSTEEAESGVTAAGL